MKRFSFILWCLALFILFACSPEKAKEFKATTIPENEVDPEVWGKVYPIHYEMYKQSQEPTPAGKSKYKRGWDADKVIYDKLSEYPFMALLYNGWGFGIEYNEPRSHFYRVIDQLEIDPSRLKPGGVCLTCKTSYAPELEAKYGLAYYNRPYKEVWSWIPEKHRRLGDSCIDCHNPKDASLQIRRGFTLVKALQTMGVDTNNITHQQMRSIICAQCHVTYVVPRDKDMKPTGVFFPWQGSKLGGISIENIIKVLKSDPAYAEWKQAVTGFKLAYIRHPEFEFFSNNSIHWNAGVSCADCHMPYKKMGGFKVSEHRIMSPLKSDMKACLQCHGETPEWLKQQVIAIQDRTMSLLLRAGYQTAVTAKLFEIANKAQESGKKLDQGLYNKAKDLYLEALYRVIFIGAENSIGFHNPTEAGRILADATAYASKSEAILRTMLAKAGEQVPVNIDLELKKYLNNRGEKKLNFKPEQEFRDPYGTQQNIEALLK
ncbi:ammonia-forming cytochrome c nitrite reductase subunit c552 [Thermodesulfovibrio sp. 3907-1M]|uniref:nitrite reductase (cytochrome; ammonia-forming) n=1 Tax=Thermodesulfovibrio autotrophicus TaxID=3118333 RepID=A0AAU8GX51_9BACT